MNRYHAIGQVAHIRHAVFALIEQELQQRGIEGLVVSHGNILDILYAHDGRMTMKEISEGIQRSKSTVTQLVEKLLKEGYVTKEAAAGDKRYTYIVLTDKGFAIKEDFQAISKKVTATFFRGFAEEEVALLLSLLARVTDNVTR